MVLEYPLDHLNLSILFVLLPRKLNQLHLTHLVVLETTTSIMMGEQTARPIAVMDKEEKITVTITDKETITWSQVILVVTHLAMTALLVATTITAYRMMVE